MNRWINRPVSDLGTRGVLAEEVVAVPVLRRPDWPGNKAAAAVRTDIAKDAVNTGCAECALVGANARFQRVGRKRLVAVLACRPEFKHGASV